MAATLQNVKVSCRGGLDLRGTSQELLSKPGYAQVLQNFECVHSGGYRRISGYTPFGINPVPGEGAIKGIYIFNQSILVARGNNLYHTFDASTWIQINKDVTDANLATITASTDILPMDPSAEDVRFAHYSNGTVVEDQMITIVNGVDEVMYFKVTGNDHNTATYTFKFLDETATGAPAGCSFAFAFKDQVYLTGRESAPSTVYISSLFDPESYTGTSSLQISTADPVRGLFPFRDHMVVFCENSIFRLSGVAEAQALLEPVTENIGCIHGDTIQEVGGDLVFLSADGIRTVAGTERINDVELSSISTMIYPLIEEVVMNRDDYKLSSVVIREKNQYRLYYPKKNVTGRSNVLGVIGTLTYGEQGGLMWSWSTTKGIDPSRIAEGLFNNQYISLMGSIVEEDILFRHDYGESFNGVRIPAIYTSPYFDVGDPSVRKNIHRVKSYIKPTGPAEVFLSIQNTGYANELPHNPIRYPLGVLRVPAIYGQSLYNSTATYGARIVDTKVVNTEGSGFSMSLSYNSTDISPPDNVQGFDLDFTVAGKV